MKKLVLILLLLSNSIFAQDISKEEIREIFWGKNDAFSEINTIPEKWKKESAVIICKSENYDYHNYRINVTFTYQIRKKIMLLDEAAVKEYSEFSFLDKIYSTKGFVAREGANIFDAKIIKPNGTVVEIDVDKETKLVEGENKIAIGNLEVGDIIDFYLYSEEKFKSTISVGFPKVERTLSEVYPIVNYKSTFLYENDFFINFKSYNGAPELVEVKADKNSDRKFQFEAKDIEKYESTRWFYPLVDLPCYKFQVYFAKNGYDRSSADAFLSLKEKIVKKEVTKEDILEAYEYKYRPEFYYNGPIENPKNFMKGKTFTNKEDQVRDMYYNSRYLFFMRNLERSIASEAKLGSEYSYMFNSYNTTFYSYNDFFSYFTAFLKDNDIGYDLIVGTSRYNGTIKDLLIKDNLTVILRVQTPTPLYIEYFNPFAGIDLLNPELENSNAYILSKENSSTLKNISEFKLPSSSAKDNSSISVSNVSLINNISEFKVNRETSYHGHLKQDEQNSKIAFYDYIKEDNSLYTVSKKYGIPKSKVEIEKKGMKAFINKKTEERKEENIKTVSVEYDATVTDYSSEILKSGRYGAKEAFIYKEDFKITNSFIKKAGNNFIIEIGKFLTAQVEIDKKEKDRKNNIYMPFPRSFDNEIVFEIPEGYSVSGLEKLNKNIVNETGQFVSEAKISGNTLTIKTSKQYNNYYEPNANWNKMIQFLDAAYQFTQEKILLKKI